MIQRIFFAFFLATTFSSTAQKAFSNNSFGLRFVMPENWSFYVKTDFDKSTNECSYIFFIPPTNEHGITNEWDNRVSLTGLANGYIQSLDELQMTEELWLLENFIGLSILSKDENSLLAEVEIDGQKYRLMLLMEYHNGICYVLSYSNRTDLFDIGKTSAMEFFNQLEYVAPEVDYADIDNRISETPEDATLYFAKAERAFAFHQLETSLSECNKAIDIFPFYGEVSYLKGYIHLAMSDTVAACQDFRSAASEDFDVENELRMYCNSSEMFRKLEEEEENPFGDFDENADHLAYVDSVKAHRYIVLSFGGLTIKPEIVRYVNQATHLFLLNYEQLDSLCRYETGIVQLYAFGYICKKFPNKVTEEHKKLLKAKGETMAVNSREQEPRLMPTKEIAATMYNVIEEERQEKQQQALTENAVKSFIQNHAKFPESYEPGSFELYHVMSIADGNTLKKENKSEIYTIGHQYKLKDSNGVARECYNTFKLDYAFAMNIIEGEESDIFASDPPALDEWLELYGRKLSGKERKKLGI